MVAGRYCPIPPGPLRPSPPHGPARGGTAIRRRSPVGFAGRRARSARGCKARRSCGPSTNQMMAFTNAGGATAARRAGPEPGEAACWNSYGDTRLTRPFPKERRRMSATRSEASSRLPDPQAVVSSLLRQLKQGPRFGPSKAEKQTTSGLQRHVAPAFRLHIPSA